MAHTLDQAFLLLEILGRVQAQLRNVCEFGKALNTYSDVLGLPANFARLTTQELAGIDAALVRLESNEVTVRAKLTDLIG